jgi:hypothetical protein
MTRQKASLSDDQRVALLLEYEKIILQGRYGDVVDLCQRFGVSRNYPARLKRTYDAGKVETPCPSVSRKSVTGRPTVMTTEKQQELLDYAAEQRYEFTCEDAAHHIGVAASTVWEFMNKHGWRKVGKTLRPLLTAAHKGRRLEWADKYKRFHFDLWVDIDEKMFYTLSTNGHRKVPLGSRLLKTLFSTDHTSQS